MRRRDFIIAVGNAAAAWPLAAHAQRSGKMPTIGFLGTVTPSAWDSWTTAFVQRLRELGWIEGRTVAIEYRWAEGRRERFAEIAAEFVRLKVDIIVTSGGAGVAAKQATSVIPIVLLLANDPVGGGLVASLARPGGNITGLSSQTSDLAGKRIEILREVLPALRRLATLTDTGYPASVGERGHIQAVATALGFEIANLEIQKAEDIVPAFEALRGSGADALYVCTGPLMNTNRIYINNAAKLARIPTMHGERVYVDAGGLMSYGPKISDMFRRAAEMVDEILHGIKPGDIPVEQPTAFELVINLKTAKTLGLEIPPTLLARADEVIE
jgi:putative tryptophan/tyrosine transport system substrate-binding protein